MAKKIFVAATGQNCGKTTTSLSLLHLARQRYRRIGFIKPVGPKPAVFRSRDMDKDAALMAQVYGLEEDIDLMSPVVLHGRTTREVLEGKLAPDKLRRDIRQACTALESQCDFLIIEGAGHCGVGSVLGLSNAAVARMLDAPALIVTGGGIGNVVDAVNLNLALYRQEGAEVRMVMTNKVLAEKRRTNLHYLNLAFAREEFRFVGGFNYSPILANPTLNRIAKVLGLSLQGDRREGTRIVHHVQLGAASTQRVADLLQENSLIIVTSSRDELLVMLASLYQLPEYKSKIAGVVIPGVAPVSGITQQIVDRSNLPYMRTDATTADVFAAIKADVSKIGAEDQEKISLLQNMAETDLDFDAIDAVF